MDFWVVEFTQLFLVTEIHSSCGGDMYLPPINIYTMYIPPYKAVTLQSPPQSLHSCSIIPSKNAVPLADEKKKKRENYNGNDTDNGNDTA